MTKSVHPFPARMAPGLALDSLMELKPGSVVLDPMSGSGTVLRQAADLGLLANGFDVDPLAVLMSRVWTTPVSAEAIQQKYARLLHLVQSTTDEERVLPWVDGNVETEQFISYWFAQKQSTDIRRIAHALMIMRAEEMEDEDAAAVNVLQLNLSRIIVTKEQAASLARDTSHSRPHRVALDSSYDVFRGYEKSLLAMQRRLVEAPPVCGATVNHGDARRLEAVASKSVDAVVTSPPYLNAIDYLRGHRMSLVWLGWKVGSLRGIRSTSIGAERGPDAGVVATHVSSLVEAMVGDAEMPARHQRMVDRYALDLWEMVSEVGRTLRIGGRATFVVGNSCLKGTFIRNADGVAAAAEMLGMRELRRSERYLPQASRYLPTTGEALAKRMRTETVLTFEAAA